MSKTDPRIKNVWISKYALTQGLYKIDEVEHCVGISDKMICQVQAFSVCYHKPDWHLTREEAVARAEIMRKKKIASLKKSLKVLESLNFNEDAAKS